MYRTRNCYGQPEYSDGDLWARYCIVGHMTVLEVRIGDEKMYFYDDEADAMETELFAEAAACGNI